MKYKFLLPIFFLCFYSVKLFADEGMWLPLLVERLNYVDMQKMGCNLTAEEIYSVNHSSIKDGIISFNNGQCTGNMVSADGLMLTNQHCAYNYIQAYCTVEQDYLATGFWAKNKYEELRNDKLTATFLIYMDDVTDKILPYLSNNMTESQRKIVKDSLIAVVEKETVKNQPLYNAKVLSFFEENEFYVFVTLTYNDVRLVGSPPESLGQFGDETDNWEWPRHGADFTFFRIYTSPDGKPAEYAKVNIPLKSKYFFPISLKGVKKDDFIMVMGIHGTTTRFMTSDAVKLTMLYDSFTVKIREKKLDLMEGDMMFDEKVDIQYKSKYASISNYYKYFIGQKEQLRECKAVEKKIAIEKAFSKWCNSNSNTKTKYGNALNEISDACVNIKKYMIAFVYYKEAIDIGIELMGYANTFEELYDSLKNNADAESLNKMTQYHYVNAKKYFKNYNLSTDKKICVALLKMFFEDVSPEFLPDIYETIQKKYKGKIEDYVDDIYTNSIFASKDKILEFLYKPECKKLDKDPGYIFMKSFYKKHEELLELFANAKEGINKGNRIFMEGMLEMNKDKKLYPNCNSSMRLTYGKVSDYNPKPNINYKYYSTIDELIAKENPKNSDFIVPSELKILYQRKDWGRYATDGELRLCFISNNDGIGGVSGSPGINGDGELVGIVFDINWESTASQIIYNAEQQRTIFVDIKYILYITDKYAGATNIIEELKLVN